MKRSAWFIAIAVAILSAGSSPAAGPISVLLEKGIYTEETAGDLDGAIKIYEQIVSDETRSRPAAAEAYLRLGNCRLKQDDKVRAREAFETVVSRFADQTNVLAKAQSRLKALDEESFAIQPAPWKDGEVMRLNLRTPGGAELGTMIWTTTAKDLPSGPAWVIEQRLFVTANNSEQFTQVIAKKDSFAPIKGLTVNLLGRYSAVYGENRVDLTTQANGSITTREIPVDGVAYDNEQALYLIRRLPLAIGYKTSFPIFPVTGASVVECRIEVAGKEKLTVTAGTFDCLKVTLAVYAQGMKALEHRLWFSDDTHRFLVRYDTGPSVMDLVEAGRWSAENPTTFSAPDIGITLSLPPGWLAYRYSSPGAYKFLVQLLPPELKLWAALSAAPRGAGVSTTARAAAEGDIKVLTGYFKNYTVRSDSWTSSVDGATASFVADYEDQSGKAMVEYRTYLLKKTTVCWFVFREDKLDFEREKRELDTLVAGFTTTDGPSYEPEQKVLSQAGSKTISEADRVASERLAAGAWTLWQQQKPAEAERLFQQAVERDPENAEAWNGLGWARQNQGLPTHARAAFEKCLALKPTHPAALNGMGWIAKAEGKNDEAICYWKKAVQSSPEATAALFGLATTCRELGDYHQAVAYARQLLAIDPANADAMQLLKETETKAGERKIDKTDYPFVDDPAVLGRWVSVDFVKEVADFKPGAKSWKDDMVLKELTFEQSGETTAAWTWTKGLLLHAGDRTASKYVIKTIGTNDYLFFEWKSGDYTKRGMKPMYCVLTRSP